MDGVKAFGLALAQALHFHAGHAESGLFDRGYDLARLARRNRVWFYNRKGSFH
jgi:hypothetical protein